MGRRPIVIAHRGASGYLPEHTLASKALAFGMGTDYLEQDVVASSDGALLVFHDLILDDLTDVAEVFPGRARADSHFYCIDFTLAEIGRLRLGERQAPGSNTARYTSRFPVAERLFTIPTLEDELRLIRGLNRSTGRRVGIYVEIKEPAWHRQQGFELGEAVLQTLARFGYRDDPSEAFIQCFDPIELQRLHSQSGCRLPLVQLLAASGGVPTSDRLAGIRRYANAIGPSLGLILGAGEGTLVADAHAADLAVHPYTLRQDDLPAGIAGFDAALQLLLVELQADGIFTDFPDLVSDFVVRHFGR